MKRTIDSGVTDAKLSSYNLFHFTDKFDNVIDVLENGFPLRFIYEKLPRARVAYLCRMTCFCDIPLGMVKYHLSWYGNYGIGLNKAYCKEYGITPVCYIHSHTKHLSFSHSQDAIEELRQNPITPSLKQQRGKVMFWDQKNGAQFKWKTFYDEKEWRYVPKMNELDVFRYKKETDLFRKKIDLNSRITQRFRFDLKQVEYVILEGKNDLKQFAKFLQGFSPKNGLDKEMMLSKVLTSQQIKNDF